MQGINKRKKYKNIFKKVVDKIFQIWYDIGVLRKWIEKDFRNYPKKYLTKRNKRVIIRE